MMRNKKGTVAMYGTALGLMIAVAIFLFYSSKTDMYMTNFGLNQTNVLQAYHEGEGKLLYIDQAAKISMQQAAYDLAQTGLYSAGKAEKMPAVVVLEGKTKREFVYWKDEAAILNEEGDDCVIGTANSYPGEQEVKAYFVEDVMDNLNKHIDAYNAKTASEDIPSGNYESFAVSSENGKTVLAANAKSEMVIENKPVTYKVMPSFKQAIGLDIFGDLAGITAKVAGKPKEEVESYGWDISKAGYSSQCIITSENSESAATCCYKYESCKEEEQVDGKCACEINGKERVYRPYTKHDYAITTDSGKSYFVLAEADVSHSPVDYRFALGWVELGDRTSICLKV